MTDEDNHAENAAALLLETAHAVVARETRKPEASKDRTSSLTRYSLQLGQGDINSGQASSEKSSTGSNSSSRSRRKRRFEQWAVDNWVWEYACWCFSTIFLLGVALTLFLHENQPLPNWPLSISINALISLLSTVSTSALLVVVTTVVGQGRWTDFATTEHRLSDLEVYDEASRGPLGSLNLLFKAKKL